VIKILLKKNLAITFTGFHILLGVLSATSKWPVIIWFYSVFATSFISSINAARRNDLSPITYLLSYSLAFEFINRLAKTSPFIPYELGKYMLLVLAPLFLILAPKKVYSLGILMLLLILPAVFYDLSGERRFVDIVYNFFAPLGLALGVMLWGGYRTDLAKVHATLKLIWFSNISGLVFTFLKTPNFGEINFSIEANFSTAAGGSTNQVASMLGIGMFISFYAWLNRLNYSGNRSLDAIIGAAFAFQGFLTFSRGGMVTGLLALVLIYALSNLQQKNSQKKIKAPHFGYFLIGILTLWFSFMQVDKLSGGKLTLRYQGETEGTFRGTQEKTLTKITSGRSNLLEDDFELWLQHPIGGVGAGASMYMRAKFGISIPPHIEMSRLVAEHGLLGMFYFLLVLRIGWLVWKAKVDINLRNILFVLYCIAILTSFHSAMRTYVTPLFVALSTMFGRK